MMMMVMVMALLLEALPASYMKPRRCKILDHDHDCDDCDDKDDDGNIDENYDEEQHQFH